MPPPDRGRIGQESPGPRRSQRVERHIDLATAMALRRRAHSLLRPWRSVLRRAGVGEDDAFRAARRASAHDSSLCRELLVSGCVGEHVLYRAIADELGLVFIASIDPPCVVLGEDMRRKALGSRDGLPLVRLVLGHDRTAWVLAHMDFDLDGWTGRLARRPGLGERMVIAAPSELRAAILAASQQGLLADAQNDLFVRQPHLSARIVAFGWQCVLLGALAVGIPVAIAVAPFATLVAFQLVAMVSFGACTVLRVLALSAAGPPRLRSPPPVDPSGLPVYSVLVALHRERAVLPQLLVALGRLQWPRAKLEIKLVCEADDRETVDALRALPLDRCIEIVEVPVGSPRTKPKALAFALPLCSGELVTLFDAEDRPHADQLLVAWQRFRQEDETLACLQAPLLVTNLDATPLSRMFAFEYAGLFRGLLPWLARHDLMLPLGGTSNHFRRAALVDVGGWDSYNVTEDADLGVRLARFGYRIGVLEHPTMEDGPEDLGVWMPQRVRWFKGWMQTWLVHMRNPARLFRELGATSFITMQILFAGMVVSALVHPIFVASVAYGAVRLAWFGELGNGETWLVLIALVNMALGYGAFLALGYSTLTRSERRRFRWLVPWTVVHWLLLSVAAWKAVAELYFKPHHWNKTPHVPARSARTHGQPDQRIRSGPPMILPSSVPITSSSRPS